VSHASERDARIRPDRCRSTVLAAAIEPTVNQLRKRSTRTIDFIGSVRREGAPRCRSHREGVWGTFGQTVRRHASARVACAGSVCAVIES
jgi:hypothetical protein